MTMDVENSMEAQVKSEEDPTPRNALQDNIVRKGQNAYYYAHARSMETIRTYGGEPQKLTALQQELEISAPRNVPIKKYSWLDGKKTVRIYVEMEGIDELADDNIELSWEEKMFRVCLKQLQGKTHELHLPKLHDEITKATYKKKEGNRLMFTLHKSTEVSWWKLQDK